MTLAALVALLGAGCGPAPYALEPEEPEAAPPAPQSPAIVIVAGGTKAEAPAIAPRREPEDRWIPDGLPRPNPFADQRTWVGTYDCTQGRTSLTLRVVDAHENRVRAIFDFHHAPTDVSGQYLMAGKFDEQMGGVVFSPGPWIIHPAGYVSVGMLGQVSRDGTRFVGRIPFPGCGGFQLRAVQ
jgi:hypothetical protein